MLLNKTKIYKFWGQLKSARIKDKKERRAYRKNLMQQYVERTVQNAKWGISYSVFDGEELLEPSLLSVRKEADYINAVYQTTSWTGAYQNNGVVETLKKLKDKGLIDEIIEFRPDTKRSPVQNEINKRNLGLKYAKKAGVDYFMTMDVDEFYDKEALAQLKKDMVEKSVTHSYCPIINYGTLPTKLKKENPGKYAVSAFCKIGRFSRFGSRKKSIAIVDPTRNMSDCFGSKYFFFCNIQMHHMSNVRNDLTLKFRASSNALLNDVKVEEIKKQDSACFDVEDQFGIMPYLNFDRDRKA